MYSFLALRSGSYAGAVQATRSEGRHGRPHHPPDCVHQGLVKIPRIFLAHVLDTSAPRVDDAFYQPRSGIPRRRRMYARIADDELSRPKPVLSCFAALSISLPIERGPSLRGGVTNYSRSCLLKLFIGQCPVDALPRPINRRCARSSDTRSAEAPTTWPVLVVKVHHQRSTEGRRRF